MAASGGFEPPECQSQSLMPYHLATRQKNGAEKGTRTPNPLITSQLRYQLRYFGKWWAFRDSNPRPSACKADALTN